VQIPLDGSEPQSTGIRLTGQLGRISVHPDGRQLALSAQTQRSETWVMPKLAQAVGK
jgi:hypothetical protein